jgi:hypothetical protein
VNRDGFATGSGANFKEVGLLLALFFVVGFAVPASEAQVVQRAPGQEIQQGRIHLGLAGWCGGDRSDGGGRAAPAT